MRHRSHAWIAVLFVLGVLLTFGNAESADAATNPYPSTQNVDGDAYYEIPCTRFAWQQVYDNLGVALPGWGNAVNWWQSAKNAGYQTGSAPKAGAVAVWSGDYYGHVAYVTSGSGNTFTVNEGGRTDLDHTNSHGVAYGYTLTNAVGGRRPYDSGKTLLGFIYPKSSDKTKPVISNAKITKVTRDGFTVSCTATDNVGVSTVKFPTWSGRVVNGSNQDDLVWYVGKKSGSTYSYDVKVSNHKNDEGLYFCHIYAYDAAGNSSFCGLTTRIDRTKPTITNAKVSSIGSWGYEVTCTVTDDYAGVDRVQFPTWTSAKGQDDLAKNWGLNTEVRGTKNGNQYSFRVYRSSHNNEMDIYNTHIYAYDKQGNVQSVQNNSCQVTFKKTLEKPKLSVEYDGKGYRCFWKPVSGATGYIVYKDSNYASAKSVELSGSTTSYYFTSNKAIQSYMISAYGRQGNTYNMSGWDEVGPNGITIKKTGSAGKTSGAAVKGTVITGIKGISKAFTIKWKKQTKNATGYQIQYSQNRRFKSKTKTVTITNNMSSARKIKKLKGSKTYFVRIRTYKQADNTKYYSAWSKVKSVKTKK